MNLSASWFAIPGALLPEGLGLQALELRELFDEARVEHRVAELLGVDRLGGVIQLGLGVAGLFVSPLAALVGLLLAGVGVGAAGKVWDNSPAGQEGMVAKAGPGGRGCIGVGARGRGHRRR